MGRFGERASAILHRLGGAGRGVAREIVSAERQVEPGPGFAARFRDRIVEGVSSRLERVADRAVDAISDHLHRDRPRVSAEQLGLRQVGRLAEQEAADLARASSLLRAAADPRISQAALDRATAQLAGVPPRSARRIARELGVATEAGASERDLVDLVDRAASRLRSVRAAALGSQSVTATFGSGVIAGGTALGVTRWVWFTAQDELVCEVCASLDGTEVDPQDLSAWPPAHPHCRCVVEPA